MFGLSSVDVITCGKQKDAQKGPESGTVLPTVDPSLWSSQLQSTALASGGQPARASESIRVRNFELWANSEPHLLRSNMPTVYYSHTKSTHAPR